MSYNQSRVDKNESHSRKPGRSGNSGNQRNFSVVSGKGGGGSAPPQPSSMNNSSSSLSGNQSFKQSGNGQSGPARVSTGRANPEANVTSSRIPQNGARVQPAMHGSSNAPVPTSTLAKPTSAPAPRVNRAVPKVPSSQATAAASESPAPVTPAKGDSNAFSFQFGSISPGFINGMQIPARTNSAPPNLDEQKRDQARHVSPGVVPTLPVPSIPKQQQPRKDFSKVNSTNIGESPIRTQAKRDTHPQGAASSGSSTIPKPAVVPGTGMVMPFQQPQVPVPFGAHNPQIQSQGVTATSLQMPMPLSMANSSQVHQQVFVPNLQTHPLQPQGIIHQGQNLSYAPQIGHPLAPQMGNITMGISSPFRQQQGGTYARKTVKITHPETHEELRLDKRTDSYVDAGSQGTRSHSSVTPQSLSIPSFSPAHQMSYYPPMPTSTYNPSNMFFQSQTSHPLPSSQVPTSSQAPRYNYPVNQGSPAISFMQPSALSALPVNKTGAAVNVESPPHPHDAYAIPGSAPSASVEVIVKPDFGSRREKIGSSSVKVSSPLVTKGESPKILRPPKEAGTVSPGKDVVISSESSMKPLKSVSEPVSSIQPSAIIENPATVSAAISMQKSLSITSPSSPAVPLDESAVLPVSTEARKGESTERYESNEDQQKKLVGDDIQDAQSQHQDISSDCIGSSKSFLPVLSVEGAKPLENVNYGVQTGEGSVSGPMTSSNLELEENVSTKQVNQTFQKVHLKQEIPIPMDHEGVNSSKLLTRSTYSGPVESNGQEDESNVKETYGVSDAGTVQAEALIDEAVDCNSQVGRTESLGSSAIAVSDSDNAARTVSSNNAIKTIDSSINESGIHMHQDLLPTPTVIVMSTEVNSELEGKTLNSTGSALVSTSGSGLKDQPELARSKSTAAKSKKKMKDILKAADAAGSISDLYMAYKRPEEKHETASSSESILSLDADLRQAPTDDAEKDVIVNKGESQSKAELDDWEDAADISVIKLKSSDDGDGNTSRKYTRDFLLTFSEQCTELPANFHIGPDIANLLMSVQVSNTHHVGREQYPNSGRIIDRSSGGPRPERRGIGMMDDDRWSKSPGPFAGRDQRLEPGHGGAVGGFRPGQGGTHGVLRNPRGPGQYNGGILSGPMQSMGHQGGMQRNSPDADRWQRATGIHRGLIPSPQTPLQIMHKAEKKYEIGKVSDEEQVKQRQLKAILNKLTPQNFEKLFEQVKEVNIDNAVTLTGVISQIFDKALMEPTFCEMYANFCSHLSSELPDFCEDNEKITFKRLLLNKCQEEFERGEREQAEADRVEEEGEIKRSEEEKEERRVQARRRMLGNIRLIGELYKKKMLTERIMHECITKLMGQYETPDEEDIEALCKLMSTIGEMIDHYKAKVHMDAYFENMLMLSDNMKLSSRVRFMLKDTIDLRRNNWRQRRKVEGPKKIEDVHRDAAHERQAQTSRLARGPSMGSSTRRGQPMDFGQRGSSMFSSPNSQMSGPRGYPPQLRGYGGQDARLEERHHYENRPLSVPMSQRPMDEDSITLGPQGGLARVMSVRGQPLISNVPIVDATPFPGDSRRTAGGPNGYSSTSDRTPYQPREELAPRFTPERFTGMPAARESLPSAGASTVGSGKVWPEEHLRDKSISAIKEFYSAKDEGEVALCIKELNSPGFYPSMISIWVTDSFERKDMERDLLSKLLVNLAKSHDSLLTEGQFIKGFESVFATLEDAVNDAPKAGEFLGRILAKVISENIVSLREIGQLIKEGGEEPGCLLESGLAAEVLGTILEMIKSEKGESVLKDIQSNSNLRLDEFRAPAPMKSKKLDAFI